MAFIFSTSHLPEYKRPEDEPSGARQTAKAARRANAVSQQEEEEDVQPLRHSGGVRAFSHLPQPVRAQADFSVSGRAGSPGRGIAQIPPRSATFTSPVSPNPRDQADPPPPEAEADHDDTPDSDVGPHEPEDSRPWYMPRLSPNDLTQAHGEEEPGSGLNRPGSEAWKEPTRDSGSNPAPGTSTKEAISQGSPALPYGRLFEKRLTPGFRDQGAGQIRNGADKAEFQDLVHRKQDQSTPKPQFSDLVYRSKANPEDEQDQRSGFFQNVADTRAARQNQSPPQTPQTFAQSVRPAAQPAQQGGQTTAAAPPPAPGNVNATPPTFKVDPAVESKMDFMLKDPVTQKKHPTDRTFGDHVRSILQNELEKSPTARNLLERIIGKTGNPVIIKWTSKEEAHPELARDGTLTVYINPTNVRIGTLTHEITHLLQTLALQKALAMKEIQAIKDPDKRRDAVQQEISKMLNGILPVSYPEERTGKPGSSQDYIENEAVRSANIAKAEISAARVKEKLDAMNKSERDGHLNDHAKIAALFWAEQGLHEAAGHDNNVKTTLEIDQRYGGSRFEHVLQILGITGKELMDACPYKKARDKAPADRAKKSQPSG